MDIAGRVVMVTGAAGTLGRAVAKAFAAEGAKLILADIAAESLDAAYGSKNDSQLPLMVDLSHEADVQAAISSAAAAFGPIEIVCNVAGGFDMGPAVHETSDVFWRGMMELNAGSLLNVTRAIVPGMIAAGFGRIVNVAAMSGLSGKGNMAAYSASKSVVIRLTESMSAELRGHGVNVNCVLPSIIDTPANRRDMPDADPALWVSPVALADVIIFLSSDKARAIHGASVPVVGLS
jgi:NAD(P)-dependent dehydrogenase (short-subunit alcohol dehydrogenase family)